MATDRRTTSAGRGKARRAPQVGGRAKPAPSGANGAAGSNGAAALPKVWGKDAWAGLMEAPAKWAAEVSRAMSPREDRPGIGSTHAAWDYWVDAAQRQILFWDVMRKRGNQAIEHYRKGKPPVLAFDSELVLDGRELARPTNYMLLRIIPEPGVEIDPKKRPFVIVDPRAGHGPGIGGMKESSQVGVAMRGGHPVYFVAFHPDPVPGQTIEDVGHAEGMFLKKVCELHPEAEGKPVVAGNCQAGWAIMMLAAAVPDLVGALSISGSPLSYWAGVEGENPMRYTGGLLGGSWLTSLTGDLGNGIFDGAYLVENFENLNPANTLWTKQYNLYSKVDTEEERYLGFEKWWSGYFFTTKEEMRFIVDELFVGNKLTNGTILTADRRAIDLKKIRAPIVVIASWGDNITPPQQALYWIPDLYDDVDEIVANEQTIIYSLDQRIGHLGIFVSAKVAEKQHAELVNTLDLIEVLPPGLYEMILDEKTPEAVGADLLPGQYLVRFEGRTIDDILALGDGREHEKAFEAVNEISKINEGLYDTFVSPWVRLWSNDTTAEALRMAHPLRLQRFLLSDLNPAMWPVKAMADAVRQNRRPTAADNPLITTERAVSAQITSALDAYRDTRDRMQELTFKAIYNSPWVEALAGLRAPYADELKPRPRDEDLEALLETKKTAIRARAEQGGFDEAVVRILVACASAEKMVDARGLRLGQRIAGEYPEFHRMGPQAFKELLKEEAFMIRFDQEHALASLPKLLPTMKERQDALELISRLSRAKGEITELRSEVLSKVAGILGVEVPAGATTEPARASA